MGQLVEGRWEREPVASSQGGRFVREPTKFHNWVTPDGSPGAAGEGGFPAEPGRYHLYVSYACPWAHRTLIFRKLKGLEELVSVSVTDAKMPAETGWSFTGTSGSTGDRVNGKDYLWQIYLLARSDYTGRATVPVLWDRQRQTIVNNESAEIIRMFNSAFDHLTGNYIDFCPEALRPEIDAVNARVYETLNNGVYRAGFATSQQAYEEAANAVFETLDWLEERFAGRPYLMGEVLTEADWRLFTTLVRFDAVYYLHFKCNLRRIADYPQLSRYLRRLYRVPGIADTVHMDHIRTHYYWSHTSINPHRIIPIGPELDFLER